MPNPIYPYRTNAEGETEECQICGEEADADMGEFILPDGKTDPSGSGTIVAHGGCGEDHSLKFA